MAALGASRARLLARFGRPVTLKRGTAEAACLGTVTRYAPDEIAGTTLRQGDAHVEILASDLTAAEYPVPPRNPDSLITAANHWTVLFANPVHDGADLIGWTLAVRGS